MKLRALLMSDKVIISPGSWATGKMPRAAFPLSKSGAKAYRLGNRSWRVVVFTACGATCRLLINYSYRLGQFQALLGVQDGPDTKVMARLELHPTHGGWHAHVACDSDEVPPGIKVGELYSAWLPREEVAKEAMQFVALLLRVQELALLSTERVRSTWVEEATLMLEKAIGGKATITPDAPVFPGLDEFPADLVIKSGERDPVALFFGLSDAKVYEALLLQTAARYQMRRNCDVVVLLESDGSVTKKARQRADNHLIVPRFSGAKSDAIGRVVEAALGERPILERMH